MPKTKNIRKKLEKKNKKQNKMKKNEVQNNQLQQQVFQHSRKIFQQNEHILSQQKFQLNQSTVIYKIIAGKWYIAHFSDPYQSLHSFCNGHLISNGKKYYEALENGDRKTIIFKSQIPQEKQQVKTFKHFKSMLKCQQHQNLVEWIDSCDPSNQLLIVCDNHIRIQPSESEWKNLPPLHFFEPIRVLIVGHRNSGKSTLCHYLHNNNIKQTCIIDLDIGRSINAPGCVSLVCQDQRIGIWVGQLTPCYNVIGYMHAMYHLYRIYEQRFSNRGLIINTMGYLTGLGEVLLYEAFNLMKPNKTILLQTDHTNKTLQQVKKKLASGYYVQSLHFSKNQNSITSQYIHFVNKNSTSKFNCLKFIDVIASSPKSSLEQLLLAIENNQFNSVSQEIPIYYQSKEGNKILITDSMPIDMQLLVLGKMNKNDNTINFVGFGFGWKGKIFFDSKIVQQHFEIAIINQGIDFDRSFYQMNEKKLIQLQLSLQTEIPYLQKVSTVLGSKGKRNLPSRKTLVMDQN